MAKKVVISKRAAKRASRDYLGLSFGQLDAKVYAELVASEQRYRLLVELSNDVIILVSPQASIVYVTPSIERMFEYKPEKVVGTNVFDYVHIAERQRTEQSFARVMAGEVARERFRFRKSDGAYVWVEAVGQLQYDDDGKVVGAFANIRDINEEYKLMEELQRTMMKFKMFHLAAQDSYNHIVITDPDGKIVFVNEAAERMTGYSQQEMLGKTPALWGKQMPHSFYKAMWKTMKVDKQSVHEKIVNKRKNGQLYTAAATISPIINGGGELIGFVGIEEDITEFLDPGIVLAAADRKV